MRLLLVIKYLKIPFCYLLIICFYFFF